MGKGHNRQEARAKTKKQTISTTRSTESPKCDPRPGTTAYTNVTTGRKQGHTMRQGKTSQQHDLRNLPPWKNILHQYFPLYLTRIERKGFLAALLTSSLDLPIEPTSKYGIMFSMTSVMGRRATKGPRSMTVHEEASVRRTFAKSSGVATLGPTDCNEGVIGSRAHLVRDQDMLSSRECFAGSTEGYYLLRTPVTARTTMVHYAGHKRAPNHGFKNHFPRWCCVQQQAKEGLAGCTGSLQTQMSNRQTQQTNEPVNLCSPASVYGPGKIFPDFVGHTHTVTSLTDHLTYLALNTLTLKKIFVELGSRRRTTHRPLTDLDVCLEHGLCICLRRGFLARPALKLNYTRAGSAAYAGRRLRSDPNRTAPNRSAQVRSICSRFLHLRARHREQGRRVHLRDQPGAFTSACVYRQRVHPRLAGFLFRLVHMQERRLTPS